MHTSHTNTVLAPLISLFSHTDTTNSNDAIGYELCTPYITDTAGPQGALNRAIINATNPIAPSLGRIALKVMVSWAGTAQRWHGSALVKFLGLVCNNNQPKRVCTPGN